MGGLSNRPVRRLVVGVPSLNEIATIRELTAAIDGRIQELPEGIQVRLVNSDNNSPDGTGEAFAALPTRTAKVALRTPHGMRGKGHNFAELFAFADRWGADGLICLDADLELVPADWLPAYLRALEAGHDLIVPLYARHWYDGNLTNQVVAPLVATSGHAVRQPIGGDFGFSRCALGVYRAMTWPEGATGFGIDVFLVLRALRTGLSTVQQPLSTGKVHSWRSDTPEAVFDEMSTKFVEVVGTLLDELRAFPAPGVDAQPPVFPTAMPLTAAAKPYDPDHLRRAAEVAWQSNAGAVRRLGIFPLSPDDPPALDARTWATVLVALIDSARRLPQSVSAADGIGHVLHAFETLFYVRLAHVLPGLCSCAVDEMVASLARDVVAGAAGLGTHPEPTCLEQ